MLNRNIGNFVLSLRESKFDCLKESLEEDVEFWKQFSLPRRHTILLNYTEEEKAERNRKLTRDYQRQVKIDVLTHYGGGKCACVKCGYSDIRALSIDHIEAKGKNHLVKESSKALYNRLRKTKPSGYQTLCMNCQFIKRIENNEMYKKYNVTDG